MPIAKRDSIIAQKKTQRVAWALYGSLSGHPSIFMALYQATHQSLSGNLYQSLSGHP